jgi:hypothetical protein
MERTLSFKAKDTSSVFNRTLPIPQVFATRRPLSHLAGERNCGNFGAIYLLNRDFALICCRAHRFIMNMPEHRWLDLNAAGLDRRAPRGGAPKSRKRGIFLWAH